MRKTSEFMQRDIEARIDELAEFESYEVLWFALFTALEADLSHWGWPGSSKTELEEISNRLEQLVEIAKTGNDNGSG